MKEIKIDIDNIKKSYQGHEVLKGISLQINRESYIAICGKSGAGKSTFMNIMGLIESFDSGRYIFNDTVINPKKDYSKIRRDYIGFIYQAYNLIPKKSCIENILMPLIYSNTNYYDKKSEVDSIVEKLQIRHLLNKDVSTLSGGEKQRVAIARSIIMNPALIIADEPTGNLDEMNKKIVTDILKKENEEGRAIVLITHDAEVAKMAKTVCTLEDGRLI